MKKSTINFIIDIFMFLCMAAIAGIGFLIKYTLIPGQERWIKYGESVELYLFGMDRHEWGKIHLIIGLVLLGLLVLHIIFHWNSITCMCKRIFEKNLFSKFTGVLLMILCALMMVAPFFIKPQIIKIERGQGRLPTHVKTHPEKGNKDIGIPDETKENKNIAIPDEVKEEIRNNPSHETHDQDKLSIDIKGYMTLDEISKKYEVPTEHILSKLNIAESVPGQQRLSWLRRNYGIEMNDIREVILEYQNKNE